MKTLWIMCGVPASGKSWFAQNKLMRDGWLYVSRDQIRYSIVHEDEEYFSHEHEVFEKFIEQIVYGLKDSVITDVIADATHINWASRRKLLNYIEREMRLDTINIIPVFIYSNFNTMLTRNLMREGRAEVETKVIMDMIKKMEDPGCDPFNYTAIMRVDNRADKGKKNNGGGLGIWN